MQRDGIVPKLVTLSVLIAATIAAYTLYRRYATRPWTRDGQLRADTVEIAPRVSGYLVEIAVEDNQSVSEGDLLFRIDPSVYELAVEQARVGLVEARQTAKQLEATVRSAEATLNESQAAAATAKSQIDAAKASVKSAIAAVRESESGVASARAKVAEVNAQLNEAEREAQRAKRLADNKAGSVQTAQAKRASVEAYTAQTQSAEAGLKQAQATLAKSQSAKEESDVNLTIAEQGYTQSLAAVAAAQANLDEAKANLGEPGDANVNVQKAIVALEQAQLNLDWTTIRAPADGFITNMKLLNSTFVSPGTPFALFVDASTFRVDAYFQETKLRNIKPGAAAMVTLMGHPGRPIKGVVESIGYAINPPDLAETEGPNNLVPSIEPTFEWIRLAQRIPVRIRLTDLPGDIHLVSGMTASIAIQPSTAD